MPNRHRTCLIGLKGVHMDRKLEELIEAARHRRMSPEEVEEQRVSFAYGNAPEESKSTIETMRIASTYLKKIEEEQK